MLYKQVSPIFYLKIRRKFIFQNATICQIIFVHKIIDTTTSDGRRFVIVLIRKCRSVEIGDKWASGEAQKGTEGLQIPGVDQVFTEEGIRLDILINPSRISNIFMN